MNQLPRYQILKDSLKDQILANIYKIGDNLPSENDLCSMHDVARSTVRQALGQLESEGYITKVNGKGSIVTARRRSLEVLSIKGFSQIAEENSQIVITEFIKRPFLTKWEEGFFFQLSDIEKGAGCISIVRLRKIELSPVMLEYTYIPNLNLTDLVKKPFVNNSLFETLAAQYKIEVTDVEQDIRAVHANAIQARHLDIVKGQAIIHIYRKYSTNKKELNLYSSLFCNTEKYSMGSY